MNKKEDEAGFCINEVKKACLEDVYTKVQGKGRTWGKKTEGGNPYSGSHITLIDGDEIVILIQPRGTKRLILKQFKLVETTNLGEEVARILRNKGFEFFY